jgi:hypothetical protein
VVGYEEEREIKSKFLSMVLLGKKIHAIERYRDTRPQV